MGKSRMGIAQIFLNNKHDLNVGRIKQPLVISSPIGPVKNSRGPDFTRSEGLIIVDAIRDCGPSDENESIDSVAAALPEKKKALSLFARKTLLKTQSLASLASPAKTVAPHSVTTPRSKFDQDEISSSISKLKSASISTTTVFTVNGDHEYTHTTKPPESVSPPKSRLRFATKLPKSKTMNVLQDIKNSAPSRANIPSTIRRPQAKKSDISLKQPDMPKMDIFRSLRRRSREESVSSNRHSSTTNITTPDSSGQIDETTEYLPRPGQVVHAQTSAYWTGRFITLRDRLSTEHMTNVLSQATETLQMGVLQHTSQQNVTHDGELSGNPPYPLREEDDLCRQVFSILESQCVTKAARESLKRWREQYARSRRQPGLLPQCSAFFGDSRISKRFASHARFQDVQSLAYLEDAYYSNASNAFGMTNLHSLEGRYLNFR
ncbi:hypothetical protein NLG97_g6781 [Lecanicillium saksenae]|uniref:Uncharacterized protein n=1 Tax=Lecanicillium saksenae TaxID=468837 RepID=A0ACC1QPU0_9HYPO|nr:hypothetical protein NLG97_g6781 [Lecanicillium saksenae]